MIRETIFKNGILPVNPFRKKKIGLALGGGGAKGFAHIGVIKVLEENNIPIDMVAGTSIGSVIGAFYCAGFSPLEMKKIAEETPWKKLRDFSFPKRGFIKGDKIEEYLRKILNEKKFSDLNKPFFAIAVDILDSREIIFNRGDVVKALRASISIPGIFNPIENNNRVLVDGGVLNNVPIKVLKEAGADIIIAVNLDKIELKEPVYEEAINDKEDKDIPNVLTTFLNSYSLLEGDRTRLMLEKYGGDIDFVLYPDTKEILGYDFKKIDLAIKQGEIETKKNIRKIREIVNRGIFGRIANVIKGNILDGSKK